ncbi:MAG: hypothetical protein IJV83_04915, partial [Clostridia bacterium]|nr:hypothetical protein [Clostridia bacterium]
ASIRLMRHKGADFAETDENKHIFRIFGKNENKKMRTFIFAFNYKLYNGTFRGKKHKRLTIQLFFAIV